MAIMTATPPLASPVKKKVAMPPIIPTPAKRKVVVPTAHSVIKAVHRSRWVPYAGLTVGVIGIGLTLWLARSPTDTASLLPWKAKLDAAIGKG